MPYQLIINTIQTAPSVDVQFLDATNNPIDAPNGAQIDFTSDNPTLLDVQAEPGNHLRGNLTFSPDQTSTGNVTITVHITNVNDVNGQPYEDQRIVAMIVPAIPATPASIVFRVEQVTPA